MKRWILLAFVGLVGCNSYVDPYWYDKPAFTEHLATIYAYPSVPVTPGKLLAFQGSNSTEGAVRNSLDPYRHVSDGNQ